MAFKDIIHKNKNLTIHKAITAPHFNEKTVLVTDTWDYVDLWLKRDGQNEARFFWNQAHSFYDATLLLPKTSAPLTAYYCFLNATKALLIAKGVNFVDQHGVTGFTVDKASSLSNEKVKFKHSGILPSLCRHLGYSQGEDIYTLKDLLYNLPIIHRAFDLTYKADKELFIPISNPKIVRSNKNNEAWFCAELINNYANGHVINKLPSTFERDCSVEDKYIVRAKKRFRWDFNNTKNNLTNYKNYHQKIRKDLHYINSGSSGSRLWYIKRGGNVNGTIPVNTTIIMFAAMHKLSELARYTPDKLSKHFDCQHNWLLAEFINSAPAQFIDEISSELTGHEFMLPSRRN
jgi:hypothetical protein